MPNRPFVAEFRKLADLELDKAVDPVVLVEDAGQKLPYYWGTSAAVCPPANKTTGAGIESELAW
ncbi:MAG: hypothetical protein ABI053_07630 [Lacisediminihabitans sp.]